MTRQVDKFHKVPSLDKEIQSIISHRERANQSFTDIRFLDSLYNPRESTINAYTYEQYFINSESSFYMKMYV